MVGSMSIPRFLLAMMIAQPMLAGAPGAAMAGEASQADIAAAAPVSPWELSLFYADRTWIWDNGAAYFAKDGRQFRAWTGGDEVSIGQGKWLVTEAGKMCMKADWKTRAGSTPAQTCFSHRRLLGTTYQRKDPDGAWYVFQATPPQPAQGQSTQAQPMQEYDKFKPGDTTAPTFEKIRRIVSPDEQPPPAQATGGG